MTISLQERLSAARDRERAARVEAARIRREMMHADRRLETQRLCTLGRAWIALGERSESFRDNARRFLASYITRDTDRAALRGTPWQVPEPDAGPPEPAGEAEHVG